MARSFHANQYENAYNNTRMSSWSVPKAKDRTAKMPKFREGSSYYIADDRGYLKPGVPRSKECPWGTFMGTWDMPHHIPNPYVHTTGRQPEAAKKLLDQVKASPLNHVSNGFVPHPLFPHCMEKVPEETAEEKCKRLQGSPLVSPQPATEVPTADAQQDLQPEWTRPSLEPCPGSMGAAGGAWPSPPRECPPRPLPQQYPQEQEQMAPITSPSGRAKPDAACPKGADQRLPDVGMDLEQEQEPQDSQQCKSPLIG